MPVLVARSDRWPFSFLADAVCPRSAEFLAEGLAPSWAVRVGPRLGGHFPARNLSPFLGGHFPARNLRLCFGGHFPGGNLRLFLGDHFPARNLRLYLGRVGLLRENRCLLATFLSPATKKTHNAMVDRPNADSRLPVPASAAVSFPGASNDGSVSALTLLSAVLR